MKTGDEKPVKGFSKKAAKQLNEMNDKVPSKLYGEPVMEQDPDNPNATMGYATVTKTKLPKMQKMKTKDRASKQAKNAAKRIKKAEKRPMWKNIGW